MRHSTEIEPSERIVLGCECGEQLVLLGRQEDWLSEGRHAFECECGRQLTLATRLVEAASDADEEDSLVALVPQAKEAGYDGR